MKTQALGVVVVRVQVPELHDGHRYLLDAVTGIHEHVLVVIGESEARLTIEDPLTFDMRKQMILKAYPTVTVLPLSDQPSDYLWSEYLDELIKFHQISSPNDTEGVVLYGGRDSFLKHYHGKARTFELPPVEPLSGTEERAKVQPEDSAAFRRGMIYASKHKYPTSYQCVDVAIVGNFGQGIEVLLGKKKRDSGKLRFIGGFVSPRDETLEGAVRREVHEETGLEVYDAEYLGSNQIDDYRYRGPDRLMSAFFLARFTFGVPRADDDLDAVQWVRLDQARALLVDEHKLLMNLLERKLNAAG